MFRSFKFIALMLFLVPFQLSAEGGIYGAFFGEENEFVCYPSVHRNFFLAIFAGVIVAGLFAWSRFRLKSRTARQLEEKNKLIEEKSKDILDSIRYASRLQRALEPEQEALSRILPESFFYLRPRDIVGGDFYFVEERDGKVIIAAIDCTGHGVPGAFLTFIGHNALRNALDKVNSFDPSLIMDAMNTEVKNSLGQQRSYNELNDGMEVGLCVFDRQSRELQYAGAGTSLYIVSGGSLEEIKGAKCSVGSVQEHVRTPPPAHRVLLNQGDMFYLNSDGIPDQFGGPSGKKFQKERMKKTLEEISVQTAAEQRSSIESVITSWMKDYEQTDDMLLIGVRV